MRILLIIPTHGYNYHNPYNVTFLSASDFPQGFAYLASALKKAGHEVYGLNPNNITNNASAYDMIYNLIEKKLQEVKPGLIGLGGLCTDFTFIRDAMQIIRKLDNTVPIVLGGGIINHDAEFIMNLLKPDFVIVGEAEKAIVELANAIDKGDADYEKIDNIGYWREE